MKILDVDLFQDGLKRNIAMLDRLESEIEAIQRTVEGLVGMEDELKGEGGNAIRAFYAECHLPLLQYFLVSAAGYKQVLQQMENALYALEPDTSGHIVEQFLEGEVEQGLATIAQLTENLTNESNSIMDQVSDIVALPHLNDSGVQESVLNAKRKRDDTVSRLQEFDATQTAALLPFEQDMHAMDTWIQNMEEMFNSNLTDIDFQQNYWAKLTSRNRFQSDLIIHTTSIAGISNKLSKESQLNLMFKTFMSSTNPIRFGYGGLIHRPSILFGPETLAFARLSSVQSDRQEKVNDTNIVDEELKVIYTELAKHPDFGNYRSDTLVDPITGEYLHTFEGMRKVVGGNGSGSPDGLAPIGMFAFDFYTEDLVTMFGNDSTVNERLAAAVFTFGKPIKIADTGLDLLKSGEKAKNTGKGTGNVLDNGTVWGNIKITQPFYGGTKIPKSFELAVDGGQFWVHPNGTKHMVEYITRDATTHGMPINSQTLLSSFENSVKKAVNEGVKYDEIMNIGNWELIFSKPRGDGILPVIKHAVYRP